MNLSSILFYTAIASTSLSTSTDTIEKPTEPPPTVQESFELPSFYQQWIDVGGFPVVASEKVNPHAVQEAAWLIQHLIGHRPDLLQALAKNNVRFSVMAYDEMTTEIP